MASVAEPSCPADGHLQDAASLEAMLAARASPARELIILVLGWTNGGVTIAMRDSGVAFVRSQLETLRELGAPHTLVITTQLGIRTNKADNLCLSRLRPLGVCCAWSDAGMPLVHNGPGGTVLDPMVVRHLMGRRRDPLAELTQSPRMFRMI